MPLPKGGENMSGREVPLNKMFDGFHQSPRVFNQLVINRKLLEFCLEGLLLVCPFSVV